MWTQSHRFALQISEPVPILTGSIFVEACWTSFLTTLPARDLVHGGASTAQSGLVFPLTQVFVCVYIYVHRCIDIHVQVYVIMSIWVQIMKGRDEGKGVSSPETARRTNGQPFPFFNVQSMYLMLKQIMLVTYALTNVNIC